MPGPPISYLEQTGGGARLPRDPFAMPPQTVPVSQPYDEVAPPPGPAITPEQARKIQGLLQAEQHKAILEQAMRDSAKPTMYMFDKAGNMSGSSDSNKRMGYGALAALLGADADRYSEENRANMFQQDLTQQGELARLPYQQMTMADQASSDFRDRELTQRSEIARMPYEQMTPYEEASLKQGGGKDPLMELLEVTKGGALNEPKYQNEIDRRIFGEQPAQGPEGFREQMASQVLDNEVQSIVAEEFPEGLKTIGDYSKANQVTAETLFEQVESGDRSLESALAAAQQSDANSPKGVKSTVEILLRKKESRKKELLNRPETPKYSAWGSPSYWTGGR